MNHYTAEELREYRVDEATMDAAAAMLGRLEREGYEGITLPAAAISLIRQAVSVAIGAE